MANFLLLYIFILVAWCSNDQFREAAWQRASPTAARLREHLFFRPPWGGAWRRGITDDKHQAEARGSWVTVELEMQTLDAWRREAQEVGRQSANASGLPKVLVVPSNPATADSIGRAAHHSLITAEFHGHATEDISNSRSKALLIPVPTIAAVPDANLASTIQGPCSSPRRPAYRSWWELKDDVANDRRDLMPSFEGKAAMPGTSSVFRPRVWRRRCWGNTVVDSRTG